MSDDDDKGPDEAVPPLSPPHTCQNSHDSILGSTPAPGKAQINNPDGTGKYYGLRQSRRDTADRKELEEQNRNNAMIKSEQEQIRVQQELAAQQREARMNEERETKRLRLQLENLQAQNLGKFAIGGLAGTALFWVWFIRRKE